SMKPARRPPGTAGFTTGACTTTLAPPGPVMVMGTAVVPCGARDQSTLTVARTWDVTWPRLGLTRTQGAPGWIRNSNGAWPPLNTSMNGAGWLWNGLSAGSTAGDCSAGQVLAEPSIATPSTGPAGGETCCRTGKMMSGMAQLLSSGSCQGALGPYLATSP